MYYVRRITNPSIAPVILMINNYNFGNFPGKQDHGTSIPNAHEWDMSGVNCSVTILLYSFKSYTTCAEWYLPSA